jgi:hypothetical protein
MRRCSQKKKNRFVVVGKMDITRHLQPRLISSFLSFRHLLLLLLLLLIESVLCICIDRLSHLSHNLLILLHTHAFFFFFFSTLQKGKTGKHNQRNAFFLKCKHNFRVDSNFLACSVFSFFFFFLFSNIKVFRSCPPGGRERKEKKNPTVRDFVTVPVIRVRYIDVKKNKRTKDTK